jgi:Tol biopolymer transport system component
VFVRGGTALAVKFDPRTLRVTGTPTPVIEGVRRGVAAGAASVHLGVAENGTLIYIPGPVTLSAARSLVVMERGGASRFLSVPPAVYQYPRASRDGKFLAVERDDGKDANIYVGELGANSTAEIHRLTFGGHNRFPVWSPDGRVAFQSDRDGDEGIFTQPAAGGVVDRLTRPESGTSHIPESWSPDGSTLLFSERKGDHYGLRALSLRTRMAESFGNVESAEPIGATFSPDGKLVAYTTNPHAGGAPSPDRGIYLQPFPPDGKRYQVPQERLDFHPAWMPDGFTLFYIPTVGRFSMIDVRAHATGGFGRATTLPVGVTHDRLSTDRRDYDVLPGGALLMSTPIGEQQTAVSQPRIDIVLNWFEELKARVSAR